MTTATRFPLNPIAGAMKRLGDARRTIKAAYDAIGRIPCDDDALTNAADAISVQMLKDLESFTRRVNKHAREAK